MEKKVKRCDWCLSDPMYIDYHDNEWGIPLHDDQKLFEFLILEGMQAGLSWLTILRKRDNFRKAFKDFSPEKVARYSQKNVERLMGNEGIIRNRLKINAAINNAKIFLSIQEAFDSFDEYIWQFTNGKIINKQRRTMKSIPVSSKESDQMSKDLKQRGFKFVGSTICYAFMQATGMVNDHLASCDFKNT